MEVSMDYQPSSSSGNIHFFSHVSNPFFNNEDMKYILYRRYRIITFARHLGNGSISVIKTFPENAFSEDEYSLTIWKCRQMINSDETIWVEKPWWIFSSYR